MHIPSLEELDNIRKSGFRPQVVGCFLNEKNILFVFKKDYDLWQLPQGGIDNQEILERAVVREMTEELGDNFVEASSKQIEIIGENKVEFPSSTQNKRDLKTDDGEDVFMKGKKYFFTAVNTENTELDISETEFDDYKWVSYEQAIKLSDKIYQKGKKRITLDTLEKLKKRKLL